MLTPLEIQNKEFRRGFRGYHEQDVDEFLDEVVRDFEAMVRETASLKDHIARLEERLTRYAEIEDVLKRTLVSAEAAAGDLRTTAEKQADLIVREAKDQAQQEIAAARDEAGAAQELLVRAKQDYRNFLARVKAELRSQLETVEGLSDAVAPESTA